MLILICRINQLRVLNYHQTKKTQQTLSLLIKELLKHKKSYLKVDGTNKYDWKLEFK